MKHSLIALGIISSLFTSCVPQAKLSDHTCKCTYVPNSISWPVGTPNKEESTSLKQLTRDDADFECTKLNSKYIGQSYTGSCLIQ
jgi:hypothetical protein